MLRRGMRLVEIAYQTDADAVVVVVALSSMRAGNLSPPARTDFDPAVAGVGAVADDKMIPQAVAPIDFVKT